MRSPYVDVKPAHIEFTKDANNCIGKGSYGTVYKGKMREYSGKRQNWPETLVAVKILAPRRDKQQEFLMEVDAGKDCYHPCVATTITFWYDCDEWAIVSELCEHSLENIIKCARKHKENGNMDPYGVNKDGEPTVFWDSTKKSCVAVGIAAGLCMIHSNEILHRDLKPANILLDKDLYPKICDFGMSRFFPEDKEAELTADIGSGVYMAPEVFDGDGTYTSAVDIYSYAMTLYALATGVTPFDQLFKPEHVAAGGRPSIHAEVPESWAAIITRCWDQIPEERPAASDLLDDAYAFIWDDTVDMTVFDEYVNMVTHALPKS